MYRRKEKFEYHHGRTHLKWNLLKYNMVPYMGTCVRKNLMYQNLNALIIKKNRGDFIVGESSCIHILPFTPPQCSIS